MNSRTAGVLIAFSALQLGFSPPERSSAQAGIHITLPANVSIPNVNDLKQKLAQSVRQPSRIKLYTREGGRLVEVTPPPVANDLSIAVRSFDPKKRLAHVEVAYPQYKMPMIQVWRFDGKAWSDSVDPGIFVR